MTVLQVVAVLIFIAALTLMAVSVYNLTLLHMISDTPKYRYETHWHSGILGHNEYKFSRSYASKRYAIKFARSNGIGYRKVIDSRTGEVLAKTKPDYENAARTDEINRRIR